MDTIGSLLVSRHRPPKIATLEVEPLSNFQTSASLILTCFLILIAGMAMTAQRGLLARLYGATYTDLEKAGTAKAERQRLAFVYHHVAAVLFVALVVCGAYPILQFVCGQSSLRTPIRGDGGTTVGDMLFMLSELYTAYYLFELVFRARFISFISLAHHVGLLIVVQTALDLEAHAGHDYDTTKEFYFCMVWGIFDVVTELPLHIVLIVWRVMRTNPTACYRIPRVCFVWVCLTAMTETVVTIYLLNQSWSQWHLEWQIITPTVFTLWIVTQLYGATIFLQLARAEGKKIVQADAGIRGGV